MKIYVGYDKRGKILALAIPSDETKDGELGLDPEPGQYADEFEVDQGHDRQRHGRYTHPSDTNPAPLDPNFEGFAIQDTDAEGRYRFKTIKPGAYPANSNWMRPPHLHFDVTGKVNRVITQMYFPGEPLNEKDLLLQSIRANKDGLIAAVLPPTRDLEPDSLLVVWNIVLDKG